MLIRMLAVCCMFMANSCLAVEYKVLKVKSSFKHTVPILSFQYLNVLREGKRFLVGSNATKNLLKNYGNVQLKTENLGNNITEERIRLQRNGESGFQCVGFVKAVTEHPFDKNTYSWRGGELISKTSAPPIYSVIAVFKNNDSNNMEDRTYENSSTTSHVAIYLGATTSYILVIDQNSDNNGTLAIRRIPWSTNGPARNSANNYRIVTIKYP